MKYAIHFVAFILIGWPSLILGYLWAVIRSGWTTGEFIHELHERASIKKWLPEESGNG